MVLFFGFALSTGFSFHWEKNPEAQEALHDLPHLPLLLWTDLPPLPCPTPGFQTHQAHAHLRAFTLANWSFALPGALFPKYLHSTHSSL